MKLIRRATACAGVAVFAIGVALAQETPSTQPTTAPTTAPAPPVRVERIARTVDGVGPVAGVVVIADLSDPRVSLVIKPATPDDPDGAGPCVTTLDTLPRIAERYDLEFAVNASFFSAPATRRVGNKDVRYFVGNPAFPVGWLVSDGKVLARPAKSGMATVLVDADGRPSVVRELVDPSEVEQAVSGNVMVLEDGQVVRHEKDSARHPRTSLGISADGSKLFMLVVDGRRPGVSVGATFAELGTIMRELGADDALNLDGGGSSTMVAQDPATGAFVILNRPSDGTSVMPELSLPRAVVDIIGLDIAE